MIRSPALPALLFSALLALFAFGAFLSVGFFERKALADVARIEETLRHETKREIELRSMRQVLADTVALRDELSERFVTDDTLVPFLERFEALGRGTGAEVEVRSLSVERHEDGTALFRLMVEAKGSWSELMQFLSLAEHMPFRLAFSTVEITKNPESGMWELVSLFSAVAQSEAAQKTP